jgi:hypothetical protein
MARACERRILEKPGSGKVSLPDFALPLRDREPARGAPLKYFQFLKPFRFSLGLARPTPTWVLISNRFLTKR